MSIRYQQHPPAAPPQPSGANGRIGVIALATDATIESDLRHMAPAGVEIFTNRVLNRNPTTVENLRAMAPHLTAAAAGLLPEDSLDALMYACTSGTMVIGEEEVMRRMQQARRGVPCTTPITAARAALECLGARRISILTPYLEEVNRAVATFFEQQAVEVLNIYGFGIAHDRDMAAVSPAAIRSAARAACDPRADVLFISCTALRAAGEVADLEQAIGKPVITSNQALMWHALKLMKRPYTVTGYGRLFNH